MLYPSFCGGAYVSQSPIADAEQTINWYVEPMEVPGATTRLALYPTPGVETITTSTSVQGRAHFAQGGREVAVIGANVVEIDSVGAQTSRGTVAIDQYPATICTNGEGGDQLFVTSGNNGYILNLSTNVFTQVRTGATRQGAAIDGYFLALDADTATVYLSDLLDGTTWDPTQFAQRSIQSDPWIALKVLDRFVWLLGSETSEVWYNAGTFPFPFAPHPSGLVDYGTAAAFSPEVVGGTLIWLGATADGVGPVLRAAGFSPDIISTFPLSVAFSAYDTLVDAIGDTYQELGHTFYLLTFPTANATWAYDATTSMELPPALRWAERGTWISESNRYDAWRPLFHAFAFNEHRMLDRETGALYRMRADLGFDADSRPIRRLRRAPAIFAENQRLFVASFELFLEPGLGLASGQGSDPQVAFRHSQNGGKTWSSERLRSAGAIGAYGTRTQWTRCGSGRRWTPEIVVTDPVPFRILGASVDGSGFRQETRREAA